MPSGKILSSALIPPVFFVLVLWLVHVMAWGLDLNLVHWGIYPRAVEGLPGILFSPFIHGDWGHLVANSVPLIILGTLSLLSFPVMTMRTVILILLVSGICTWLGGRPSWHIGASGIIYGLAAFLLVGGIITKQKNLKAISLIVIFLYSGMVVGLIPGTGTNISWEGHLFGAIGGIVAAVLFARREPVLNESELPAEGPDNNHWDYTAHFPEREIILRNEEDN